MALRLIKISPRKDADGNTLDAAFEPDILGVNLNDVIYWNNETREEHWLVMTDGGFMTNRFPGPGVSDPGFPIDPKKITAPATLEYTCKLHPGERATIEVVALSPGIPVIAAPLVAAAGVDTSSAYKPKRAKKTATATGRKKTRAKKKPRKKGK